MSTNYECPRCGSQNLDIDDGSFDYDGPCGVETHTPDGGAYFNCHECDWEGYDAEDTGSYMAMLEYKADAQREEKLLDVWEQTVLMNEHNDI